MNLSSSSQYSGVSGALNPVVVLHDCFRIPLRNSEVFAALNPVVVLHDCFQIENASFFTTEMHKTYSKINQFSVNQNRKSFSSFHREKFHRETSKVISEGLVFDFIQNQYIKKEKLQDEDGSGKSASNTEESKSIHKDTVIAPITGNLTCLKVDPQKSASSGHACDICKRIFAGKCRLKTHRLLHTGEKPHKCTECGKKFTRSDTLRNHREIHRRKWSSGKESDIHQSGQTSINTASINTSQPNGMKQTDTNSSFCTGTNQLLFRNRNPQDENYDEQTVSDSAVEMTEVIESTSNTEKPLSPESNGTVPVEIIASSDSEEPSKFENTSNSIASYVCDICNRNFTCSEHLKSHQLTHTGPMPFGCTECEQKFTRSDDLERHFSMHHRNNLTNTSPSSMPENDLDIREKNLQCEDQSDSSTSVVGGGGLNKEGLVGPEKSPSSLAPYVCNVCNKSFSRLTRLKTHCLAHAGEKPYECTECKKKFARSDNLKRHMDVYHSKNSINTSTSLKDKELSEGESQCEDESDGNSSEDGSDVEWAVGPEKAEEDSSDEEWAVGSIKNPPSSISKCSGEKIYECVKCETKFTRLSNLNRHIKLRCSKNSTEISCSVKGQADSNVSAVEKSSSMEGNVASENNASKLTPCFVCDICNKAFIRITDLTAHCRVHSGEKLYECTACKTRFTRSSNLRRHIRKRCSKVSTDPSCPVTDNKSVKEGNMDCDDQASINASVVADGADVQGNVNSACNSNPLCLVCDACNKTFTEMIDLERHRLTHSNERPYECTECEMKFTRSSNLRRHIRVHYIKNSTNNSCPVAVGEFGRNMKCEDQADINASVVEGKSDIEVTPNFVCDVCDRSFTQFNHLQTHCLIHTEEKTYDCAECGKKFSRPDTLKCHVEGHRGGNSRKAPRSVTDNEPSIREGPSQCESIDTDSDAERPVGFEKNSSEGAPSSYVCDVCNRSFITKRLLKTHCLIHMGETSYECLECGKIFPRSDSLKHHRKRYHKKGTDPAEEHKCSRCDEKFTTLHLLAVHRRIHATEKRHACTVCSKAFRFKTRLNAHFRIHANARLFVCTVCGKGFNQKTTLKSHMRTHTSNKPYECALCDAKFTAKNALTRHMYLHTGEKPHECDVCHKKFACSTYLRNHLLIHTGEKPYACDICQKKFTRKNLLDEHKSIHTGDMPYQCDVCKKGFTYQYKLKMHYRIHTNDKQFSCDICNKAFGSKHNFLQHRRLHTGEKPYICSYCKKAFAYVASYDRHLLIHTGAKPFTCKVCNLSFNQKGSLHRHQVVHTGEKPYPCDICHQGFTQKSYLSIHRLIHSGERPFACEICHMTFTRRSELKKHTCTGATQIPARSRERSFVCEHCEESFPRRLDLKKHACTKATPNPSDSGDRSFVCEDCKESFSRRSDLRKHACTEAARNPADSGERVFACEFCEESFTRRSDLKKHTCKEVEFKIEWVPDDQQVFDFSTLF